MTETRNEIPPPTDSTQFLSNKDIVIVSLAAWDGPKRIRQYLTEELVKRGNRVLFVEAYYTLSKFIKGPNLKKFFRFLQAPQNLRPGLLLLPTIPFLPLGEFNKLLSKINWTVERFLLRRAIRKLGFRDVVLWVFAYNADALVGRMSEQRSIYFCNDAFSKLVQSIALQEKILELERSLMEKVDIVFTVSEKLSEEKSRLHHNVHTIHHGVDYPLFEKTLRTPAAEHPRDLPSQQPLIGYSGVIRYMIDLDVIEFLAEQRPNWSITFVGPIAESSHEFYQRIETLKKRPNIHFLGSKRPEEIPRYIGAFDVCLLPYIQAEISTYYAAPLKFYEYLAAGKPVVSTVGPLNYDDDVVVTVTSKEEMVKAIETMLQKILPAHVERRKAIARENSWAHRIDQIETALQAPA